MRGKLMLCHALCTAIGCIVGTLLASSMGIFGGVIVAVVIAALLVVIGISKVLEEEDGDLRMKLMIILSRCLMIN